VILLIEGFDRSPSVDTNMKECAKSDRLQVLEALIEADEARQYRGMFAVTAILGRENGYPSVWTALDVYRPGFFEAALLPVPVRGFQIELSSHGRNRQRSIYTLNDTSRR
jgi:hypothetical protein